MTSSESWCPLAVWCQPMAASSSLTNSDRLRGQTIIVVSCDTETQAGDIKSGKYEAVSPALNKQQHMCGVDRAPNILHECVNTKYPDCI